MLVVLLEVAFHEWRIDGTWADTIHTQLFRVFHSQLPGHRHYRAFSSTVREPFSDPHETRDRTDVDDGSLGGYQEGYSVFRSKEASFYIDAEQALKVADFCFFDAAHQPDSGIVHQDVEA